MELMLAKCLEGAWLRGLCSHFPKLSGCPLSFPPPNSPFPPASTPLDPSFSPPVSPEAGGIAKLPEGRPHSNLCHLLLEVSPTSCALPSWGFGKMSWPLVPLHHLSAQLGLPSLPVGEPVPFPVVDSRASPPPSRLGPVPGCTGTEQVQWRPPD